VAIFEFNQQIKTEDINIDTGFAEKIIATELPGVLNWIIGGLDLLLVTNHLNPPPCCVAEVERIRIEVDPLSGWLDDRGYRRGKTTYITLKDAHLDFVGY
jgi:phage/plasmid-associated DNA primase